MIDEKRPVRIDDASDYACIYSRNSQAIAVKMALRPDEKYIYHTVSSKYDPKSANIARLLYFLYKLISLK